MSSLGRVSVVLLLPSSHRRRRRLMLTKILAGCLVLSLLSLAVGGVLHKWTVNKLEKQVTELQEANIKLEVETKAQKATITFLEKQKAVKVRVIREKSEIKKTVESGSTDNLRDLYNRYRKRVPPKNKIRHPKNGRGGSSEDQPAG